MSIVHNSQVATGGFFSKMAADWFYSIVDTAFQLAPSCYMLIGSMRWLVIGSRYTMPIGPELQTDWF